MRAKAPLADQGELSRASPASTRLRGSELPSFCVLSLTQFDNPSVKNQRFLPAVHCGMTATGSHGNFDSLRGAPPFTQGSHWVLPHQRVYRYFSEESEKYTTFFYELSKIIIPHSLVRNDTVSFRPFSPTQPTAIRSIPNCFRRCGRGILKGAAFRQRPLSRLLINFLAGTRTLPPEGSEPKHLWRVCAYAQVFTLSFLPSSVSRLRETRKPPSPLRTDFAMTVV